MGLASIINVQISLETAGVGQAGFGTPLILSHSANWTERVRFYNDLPGVAADFATTSPEYKAASFEFAQVPSPTRIGIGRASNKPTQRWKLTVSLVKDNTLYAVRFGAGQGASFTSGVGTTNDLIITGLLAAWNGISGVNVTAAASGSVGSKVLDLTSNTAGTWNDVEVIDVNLLSIEQNHTDPGLAADLTAIRNETDEWYALITNFNSAAYVLGAATWVEANGKLYGATVQDTPIITVADSGATDIGHSLKNASFFRTFLAYHPATGGGFAESWFGKLLPMDPGSETWFGKTLATVSAVTLSATHIANLEAKNVNYYRTMAKVNITQPGKVASGEWIDVVRFRDWLVARLQESCFALLIKNAKVAMTNAGITLLEAEIRAVLDAGVKAGGLNPDNPPTVTMPKSSAISSGDRTARVLNGIKFTGQLAGAIHAAGLNGTITS